LLPPGDKKPFFKLETGGPTSSITSLAFDSKGNTLYVGGFDKVVRRWTVNAQGRFVLDRAAYRVPIGPGNSGAINAIALSDDDALLAVGGSGPYFGEMSEHEGKGVEYAAKIALNDRMRRDRGVIHVFDTRTQATIAVLRGHVGPVLSLTFAPSYPGKPPLLVSAGGEWDETTEKFIGKIRVWDVSRKAELAVLAPGLPNSVLNPLLQKPGLTAWHTGQQMTALRVAIAWEDGRLRVWDVDRAVADSWEEKESGKNNCTAHYLVDRSQLLTSRMLTNSGSLEIWDTPVTAKPQRRTSAVMPPENGIYFFPRTLAPLSSKANGKIDLVAVGLAARSKDGLGRAQLKLVDLDRAELLEETVPLWKEKSFPILASSPKGKYLAVAGDPRHEVLVFAVDDLSKPGAKPIQRIGNSGLTFSGAVFATKEKNQGVILKEGDQKVVLDFTHSNASTDIAGWTEQHQPAGSWAVQVNPGAGPSSIAVRNADESKQVPIGAPITATALLQPAPPLSIPFVAVATFDNNASPELLLFDAASGKRLRRYLGHSGRIRSLAFSGDGRLLVSTSEDETVCIWSLTDLPQSLGQHGTLPFTPDIDKEGKITVRTLTAGDPSATQLEVGSVVTGLVEVNDFRPAKTLRELYEAAYATKPGQTITLRVGGKDVSIAVIQEVDVRSPLFSLFLTRGNDWIGWNPIGAFESSGKQAERHLGWHFNTGQPNAPTRFAAADQFSREYFRKGLLKELVERGELRKVPDPPPLPAPRMTLLIEENDNFPELNAQKQYVVRHGQVQAHVAVFGRPLESLQRLTWQMDDGVEHPIDLKSLLGHELPPIPLELARGAHAFRVRAYASDVGPIPTSAELVVRYQPPPPRVVLKAAGGETVVKDPAFRVEALVHAPEDVKLQLTHRHKNTEITKEAQILKVDAAGTGRIERPIQLQPGSNRIEVIATNANALEGHEDLETAQQVLEITLIEKARPPALAFENFTEEGRQEKLDNRADSLIHVSHSKITISGKIEATENLTEAAWQSSRGAQPENLAGFAPGTANRMAFTEPVDLQPGRQRIRFLARTKTSDQASRELEFFYQPPVPSLVISEPGDGLVLDGEKEVGEVSLEGRLLGPANTQPYRSAVFLNGKESSAKLALDEKSRALSARIAIRPGNNAIEVRLKNEWGSESAARTQVTYLRPPRAVELTAPAETKTPTVDVLARIWSPVPLQNERLRLEVNGTRQAIPALTTEKTGDENIWLLKLKDILLQGGTVPKQNLVRLWVGNSEADCRKPAEATILYKPEQPPPVVEILEPRTNARTTSSSMTLRFLARSTTPLRSLKLVRDGAPAISVDVTKLKPDGSGKFELKAEEALKLATAFNNLRLEAVNDGGHAEASVNVNYVRMPVRLQITEPADGAAFKQSRVTVRGKLLFDEVDERDDPRLSQAENVRVFVNGFLQPPVKLGAARGDAANGWERSFEGTVLLNHAREQENVIKVALANFAEAEGPSSLLNVRCLETEKPQRIHLLVVSPEEKAQENLKKEFSGVLKSFTQDPQHFLPAEDRYLNGDDASLDNVLYQLVYTRHKIDKTRSASPGTDLLMLYYRGTELVTEDDHFFRLKGPALAAEESRYQLRCASLAERFAEIPGAQILLLDVHRQKPKGALADGPGRDMIEKWSDFADIELHSAVMRYAWFGVSDVPGDARLIKALEEAMPKANKLVEVSRLLGDYPALRQMQALRYTPHIHSELGDMVFGSRQ
jgi:WD40 repeat protein